MSSNSWELPDDFISEWAIFDTDMAPPTDDRSQVPPPYSQPPPTVPPQLPPETYTYLIHALLSLQSSGYLPIPNYNYPWPLDTSLSASAAPSSMPLPPRAVPQGTSSSQLTPHPAASTAQDPEGADDAIVIAEDKRRRNTAASARFRVKKKQKTLNLERVVADLTGRTEELEREANDLRRENAWLKEIVLLKGRNVAASSLVPGSQAPTPGNRHDEDEEEERTHAGSELESTVKRKGKGKKREN